MAKPFKKALEVLKHVAPTAAAALGGPMGPMAARVIRDVLGVSPETDVDDAVLAAAGDPNAVVKLKEIEATMQAKEAELGVEFERISAEDRASARQLAVKTTLWPQIVLASLYTIAYIATLWAFVRGYASVAPEHNGLVQTLIGALGAVQIQILNFFFGSSSGSAKKTEILAKGD